MQSELPRAGSRSQHEFGMNVVGPTCGRRFQAACRCGLHQVKRTEKEQSAKQADANRTRFGRTKSERTLEERRASRASDLLDQHRIDGEDAS